MRTLLLLLVFHSLLITAYGQFNTWESANWLEKENPFRKLKRDHAGNLWELKSNQIIRITPSDTTLFDYLIRFENTGNDVAYHVKIIDTLHAALDWSTFELVSSSHNVVTQLSPKGELIFSFPDINLPDTTTNKEAANGFVRYKIKPRETTTDFTAITNKAHIIFDKNNPIVTNETLNTIVKEFPVSSVKNPTVNTFYSVFPNPASDLIHFKKPAKTTNVSIISSEGRIFYTGMDESISTLHYTPGTYIVLFLGDDGEVVQAERVVIMNY